jgi:hypothetical protein
VDAGSGGAGSAQQRRGACLNAAWPGVSRNVMRLLESGMVTENAPTCCVMPPASPAATRDRRSASSSVVLPWSTCPTIVTTGGRGRTSRLAADSCTVHSYPKSSASSSAASVEILQPQTASVLCCRLQVYSAAAAARCCARTELWRSRTGLLPTR